MGWSDVDDVDKERRGKESDSIVVIVGMGKKVRVAGEGVWTRKKPSWDIDHVQIEVGGVNKPMGLSMIEVLGGVEVGEVLVVGEDLYRERISVEIVSPVDFRA